MKLLNLDLTLARILDLVRKNKRVFAVISLSEELSNILWNSFCWLEVNQE